jgi:hypothetical protein
VVQGALPKFHLHPGFKYKGNQSLFYAQSAEQTTLNK